MFVGEWKYEGSFRPYACPGAYVLLLRILDGLFLCGILFVHELQLSRILDSSLETVPSRSSLIGTFHLEKHAKEFELS